MARCNCSGGSCSCVIVGSGSISVDGAGSEVNPYVVSGGGVITANDTPTVDMTLSGDGTALNPYVLEAAATVAVDDLSDVTATDLTTGYVLTRQADGTWAPAVAPTASPGLISTDTSLTGDGSAGAPLAIQTAFLDSYFGSGGAGDLSAEYATQSQYTDLAVMVQSLSDRLQIAEQRLADVPLKMYSTTVPMNPVPNRVTSLHVNFPDGMFSSPPRVLVSANTSVPFERVKMVSAWNVDATGCNVAVYRTNSTNTGLYLLAIDTAAVPEPPAPGEIILDGNG